jgi:dipeptidyl aminopeptidase/acylaminoacyl peptidase
MLARLVCALTATVTMSHVGVAPAGAESILFRCGPNICRVAPNGSGRTQLTSNGRNGGPSYGWLSASKDGSRLGVAYGNKAYVLDGSGRRLQGPLRNSGAVLVSQIRPDGRELATIEQVPEILYSPPPFVPVNVITPFLFLASITGAGRDTVARSTPTAGWLGNRLMIADRADASPFPQGICLLVSNANFKCQRSVAVDPGHDLWGPVTSPDGRFIAATRAPVKGFSGDIAVYLASTGALVRSITTGGRDSQPAWSPDGKRIVFARASSLYVVTATGGAARRIATAGVQPVWVRASR